MCLSRSRPFRALFVAVSVSLLVVRSFAHLLIRFVYSFVCSPVWLLVVLAGAANLLHDALAEHEQYSPIARNLLFSYYSPRFLFPCSPIWYPPENGNNSSSSSNSGDNSNRHKPNTWGHTQLPSLLWTLTVRISWFISRAIEREFIQIMIVIECINPAQRAHKHKILSKIFCKRHQFSVCIDLNWLDADLSAFDGWKSSNVTTQLRRDETWQWMNGIERPTGKTIEKCNVHFQWKTSGERREKNVQHDTERKTEQCVYRNKQELFSLFNTQLIARRLHVTGAFHRISAYSLWTSLQPYPNCEHRPNFRVLAAEYEYDTSSGKYGCCCCCFPMRENMDGFEIWMAFSTVFHRCADYICRLVSITVAVAHCGVNAVPQKMIKLQFKAISY